MAGNFIKIDRKILKWEWWNDINTFRLFMYMLISAYWKDGNYKGKIIERGSFPSSISELSKETNLSVMEIRTSLKHLQLTGEITSKATNKFTIFTVVNYNLYQTDNKQDNKQITSNLTNNQQTDNILLTNSILKESKNERKDICQNILDLFNRICCSFGRAKNITKNRAEIIDSSLKAYSFDDFKKVFEKAEQSDFLKGNNNRNWSANFDWLIKEDNMTKVLKGKYDKNKQPNKFCDFPQRQYDFSNDKELIIKNC